MDYPNGRYDISPAVVKITPQGLHIAEEPYPHLRDESGCILARDYVEHARMAFILEAVAEKIARESGK